MATAYLFASVNMDTMQIEFVRTMSDRTPTCYTSTQTWLKIAESEGETFAEAIDNMNRRLEDGDLRCWHEHLDSVKAIREYEAREARRKSEELQDFWVESEDVTGR